MKDYYKLVETLKKFNKDRGWTRLNPKDLAMSVGIESGELMEIFQWLTHEQAKNIQDEKVLEHIGEEIADVVIYAIALANQFDMDVLELIEDKIEKNAKKYPLK